MFFNDEREQRKKNAQMFCNNLYKDVNETMNQLEKEFQQSKEKNNKVFYVSRVDLKDSEEPIIELFMKERLSDSVVKCWEKKLNTSTEALIDDPFLIQRYVRYLFHETYSALTSHLKKRLYPFAKEEHFEVVPWITVNNTGIWRLSIRLIFRLEETKMNMKDYKKLKAVIERLAKDYYNFTIDPYLCHVD